MKLLKLSALLLVTTLFFSCGGVNENQIVGDWNLTGFISDGENIELTECDKQTIWSFSLGAGGDLIDGTAVKKLDGKAPDHCEFYDFDAQWMLTDGKLFISNCRIGGMGGASLAGVMTILELSESKMVLKSLDKEITLEK